MEITVQRRWPGGINDQNASKCSYIDMRHTRAHGRHSTMKIGCDYEIKNRK